MEFYVQLIYIYIMKGGKRPGAGRPKGIPKKQQCIYLSEPIICKVDKIAKTNKITKNKIYEEAISQFIQLL